MKAAGFIQRPRDCVPRMTLKLFLLRWHGSVKTKNRPRAQPYFFSVFSVCRDFYERVDCVLLLEQADVGYLRFPSLKINTGCDILYIVCDCWRILTSYCTCTFTILSELLVWCLFQLQPLIITELIRFNYSL